jgi:polyphosphate glucokinase
VDYFFITMTLSEHTLGIDVGGSSIKAGIVDPSGPSIVEPINYWPTPPQAQPHQLTGLLNQIIQFYGVRLPVGIGFPGVVTACGRTLTAPNLGPGWHNVDLAGTLSQQVQTRVTVLNDADAAGIALIRSGQVAHYKGLVIVITIGTGLGSALIYQGQLIPNTELGHLFLLGMEAEKWASAASKTKEELSTQVWAQRFLSYLRHLCTLFNPDCFVLGGGIADQADSFLPWLQLPVPIQVAPYGQAAGLMGAGLWASRAAI